MNIISLDGVESKWKMESKDNSNPSSLHLQAVELVKNIFPTMLYLEEIEIEVKKRKYLYLDIYLPLIKLAIEIDGGQHEKYNNFMHGNQHGYLRAKLNDRLKESWCELNGIQLIRLKHDESCDEWRTKLGAKDSPTKSE